MPLRISERSDIINSKLDAASNYDQFFLEKVKQQTLSSANAAVDAAKEVK